VALDAALAASIGKYRRETANRINVCCGQVNRGVAISRRRVFVGTVDATWSRSMPRLAQCVGDVRVADHSTGQCIHGVAPLVVKTCHLRHQRREYDSRFWMLTTATANAAALLPFPNLDSPAPRLGRAMHGKRGAPTWTTGSFDADRTYHWALEIPRPIGMATRGAATLYSIAHRLDADTAS